MKLMQMAFIAVLGTMCLATVATSKTIHPPCEVSVQELTAPAPTKIYPKTRVIASSTAAVI